MTKETNLQIVLQDTLALLETKERKIKELEYQKHGIQCVLHDCFMTLLENKIIKPDMKFYKDIVNAKEL
jgi:hypothetical protein